MQQIIDQFSRLPQLPPLIESLVWLSVLVVLAVVANWIAKQIVVRMVSKLILRTSLKNEANDVRKLVSHLSNVVPALIIQKGIVAVPELPLVLVKAVQDLSAGFIIFTLARVLCDLLDLINDAYEDRPDAGARPIKGYLQVGKLLIYAAATILIVASLTGQSPLLLLSGLGAMAAVLMLIFRDTILSLVASVQLRSDDMLRVGDWVEMPQLNADGDVIDISLHSVKVQNFDKTVTSIPTHKFVSDAYRNWRFMRQWGGRRIKRSLLIDKSTIGFLSPDQWDGLRRFTLLESYMNDKERELGDWNAMHAAGDDADVNKRRPTNIGCLRAYIVAYLKAHPRISERGMLLVRQLAPTERGLPLEIYCFTNTVAWAEYEAIQADIFDHLLAILPQFNVRAFQEPSGHDLQGLAWPQAESGSAPHDAEPPA